MDEQSIRMLYSTETKANNKLKERIKELEGVIEAALRISDLWTLGEVETMFEDEAKVLETMKANFEQVLCKPCTKKG